MKLIDKITSSAFQTMTLTGNSGQRITLNVRYMPTQQSWFMDIVYDDFSVYGVSVVASLNILRRYRNIIPFGLYCTTEQGIDPFRIDDFESGYAKIFLLNESDVEAIEGDTFE